jgi:hypothetical protein
VNFIFNHQDDGSGRAHLPKLDEKGFIAAAGMQSSPHHLTCPDYLKALFCFRYFDLVSAISAYSSFCMKLRFFLF